MKNKIFLLNILMIILTGILILTTYSKNRIPDNIFDNLMIIYGVLYAGIIITVIILYIVGHKGT